MKTKQILLLLVMGLMMVLVMQGVVGTHSETPALGISEFRVNNQAVAVDGQTPALKPQQQMTASFKVTNTLDHPITGIGARLTAGDSITFEDEEELSVLNAGESRTLTLVEELPYTLTTNNYAVELKVEGTDFNDVSITHTETYPFQLNITQAAADLVISDYEWSVTQPDGSAKVTCENNVDLIVELTNRAYNPEDDVELSLSKGTFKMITGTFPVAQNEQTYVLFEDIASENLSPGSNTFTLELKYRDGSQKPTQTITLQKDACLSVAAPTATSLLLADNTLQSFSVSVASGNAANNVQWFVGTDDKTASATVTDSTSTFTSSFAKGDFVVKTQIGGESKTWNVKVTDKPLTSNFQIPVLSGDLTSVQNFYVEKTGVAKIAFTGSVNLDNIANLDEVVVISGDTVAVDATKLNGAARITLPRTFTKPLILKATGFNAEPTAQCTDCTQVSNTAGQFVFDVLGFSTYKVVEEVPAALEVTSGEVLFSNATRGENPTVTVTVKNKGTFESLTISAVATDGVNSGDYNPRITGLTTPKTLAAGESTTLTLQVKIPEDEAGGKHSIGSLKITSDKDTEIVPIFIQPKSFLAVTQVKVDGSTSGDLLLDEVTKISVTVENQHAKDMKDVRVTVKILDVGDDEDDDLEKVLEIGSLDDGREKTVDFEFDLSKETLDEDSYDVEITVEGEDDDNVDHETVEVKNYNVKRENHHLILKTISLGSTQLECSRETTLQVTVENVGKNDEDDVEVRVKNAALNVELKEVDMEVNKFSDSDNEERVSFALDLADAEAGTYPLTVEVYRDGSLEESKEVTLTVAACGTSAGTAASGSTAKQTTDQIAQQLQQALVDALSGKQDGPTGAATAGTFRESTAYVVFLAVIGALLLTAVVLSIAVLARK